MAHWEGQCKCLLQQLVKISNQPLDVSAVLVKLEADINNGCKFWIVYIDQHPTCVEFCCAPTKKIPSEMEVAPRYKLMTLLTLFTLFTLLGC